MTGNGQADRLCHRWVRIYTRRLSADVAEQRRQEIESDLWEHRRHSLAAGRSERRHNLDVIERVLSGIPADLSWRRGIQRSLARPDTGDPMTTPHPVPRSTIALIIVASLAIMATFPFLALLGTELGSADLLWLFGALGLAGTLAAGLTLRLRGTNPAVATALLMVGAFAPSVAWFWLPPVYLLTVAVVVTALMTVGNRPTIKRQPA